MGSSNKSDSGSGGVRLRDRVSINTMISGKSWSSGEVKEADLVDKKDEVESAATGSSSLGVKSTVSWKTTNDKTIFFADFDDFDEDSERDTWESNIDFLLTTIGGAVGLGNLLRFPYLCFTNGGGAFLLPYIIFFFLMGIPLAFLEISIGQYMSRGGMQAWNIIPLFQGLGLSTLLCVYMVTLPYSTVMSWLLFYMWRSADSTLPWSNCDNEWNTIDCREGMINSTVTSSLLSDPVTEFWLYEVLKMNDGDNLGEVNFDLSLCLLVVWGIVFICVYNGMKSTGKISHLTATIPSVLLATFLIHNLLLDGAMSGVYYFIVPEFVKLRNPQVWYEALVQVFYSLSIGWGTLPAMGSYNDYYHNCFRDIIIIAMADFATSLVAGFTVFAVLGNMAKEQGKSVKMVAQSGPGLAFHAYPKAILSMPFPSLISFFYFLMLFLLALDTQFITIATILAGITDQYPRVFRKRKKRTILTGCLCCISAALSIPTVFEGGMYVYTFFNTYAGAYNLPFNVCLELFVVMILFGADRFIANLSIMLGDTWLQKILPFIKYCWCILGPIACFVMIACASDESTVERHNKVDFYFPNWAVNVGRAISITCYAAIPLVFLQNLQKYGASLKTLKLMLRPHHLMPHQRLPNEEVMSCLGDFDKDHKSVSLYSKQVTATTV